MAGSLSQNRCSAGSIENLLLRPVFSTAIFVLFCFWAQLLNLLVHAPGIYEHLMRNLRIQVDRGRDWAGRQGRFLAGALPHGLPPHFSPLSPRYAGVTVSINLSALEKYPGKFRPIHRARRSSSSFNQTGRSSACESSGLSVEYRATFPAQTSCPFWPRRVIDFLVERRFSNARGYRLSPVGCEFHAHSFPALPCQFAHR